MSPRRKVLIRKPMENSPLLMNTALASLRDREATLPGDPRRRIRQLERMVSREGSM